MLLCTFRLLLGTQEAPEKGQLGQRPVSPARVHSVYGDGAVHGTSGQRHLVWVEREAPDGADTVAHKALVEANNVQAMARRRVYAYVLVRRTAEKKRKYFPSPFAISLNGNKNRGKHLSKVNKSFPLYT